MRGAIVWTIFRKELIDSLRDRRTLIMMVGLPLLLYPLLILGVAKLQESQMEASEARKSKVALWGTVPDGLRQRLEQHPKLEVTVWSGAPEAIRRDLEAGLVSPPPRKELPGQGRPEKTAPDQPETPQLVAARSVILDRRCDAVLLAWPDLAAAEAGGGLGHISIYFDSVRPDSTKARERLSDLVGEFRRAMVERRERERGLASGFAQAVELRSDNVAPQKRRAGMILGTMLGAMLIAITMIGGFYSAIDLTAGEKERGTMQTLLCAPVRTTEIIAGKFLAVWTQSLVASLVNVASMGVAVGRATAAVGDIHMTPGVYALALVVLIPVSFTSSALFLAVASFAKDFKDGQNLLGPLLTLLLLPIMVASTPAMELSPRTAFVPVVNIVLLIKALFLAEARADVIFLTLLASCLYAMLAILLAARVFSQESVLLGGRESFRSVFVVGRQAGGTPTPGLALLLFAVVVVVAFYGSLLLRNTGLVASLLAVELGFLLLPNLVVTAGLKFSARETLALHWPPWQGMLAAVLLGCSGWAVAAGAIRVLPPPESLVRALEKILLLDDRSVPLWALWLLVGVAPGLCEELLFRGFILSGLRSLGKWPALTASAALFGLAHASVYRFLPTLVLGLLFGYAVWKTRSVVCGIIAHALTNGLMATLARSDVVIQQFRTHHMTFLPWSITLAGAAVTLAAVLLLRRLPERRSAA